MKTSFRTFYQVERISLRDKDLFWKRSPGLVGPQAHSRNQEPEVDEVIVGAHKRINDNLPERTYQGEDLASSRGPCRSRRRILPLLMSSTVKPVKFCSKPINR